MTLTFGSLFAGVGGFDLGFEEAGWKCKWQVEWDKNCQNVLNYRWPDVVRYSDVQEAEGFNMEPVDVVTFGSPCQDLSVAGKREGLGGSRSSMFYEAVRVIREMRYATNGQYPRIAVWENVAGALTSNKGNDFATVIDEMANIGALAIEWHILDAQWFGVPQRRRRVFLVACFDPRIIDRCGSEILPVGKSSSGDSLTIGKKRKQNARAIKNSVSETGKCGLTPYVKTVRSGARDSLGNLPPEVWENQVISPTLNTFDNGGESRSTVLILDATRVNDFRIYNDGITPTLKARMGTGGNQVPMIVRSFNAKQDPVSSDNITPPIPPNKGEIAVGIPIENDEFSHMLLRRLTPKECERLMGFPDDHTLNGGNGKVISDTNRYKMIGNAVAVPVSRWIATQLKKHMSDVV